MPFDNAPIMISTGCGPCDRSSPLSPELLAADLACGDAARKRAQRVRDAGAGLVRVEVRVSAAMAPVIRWVAAALSDSLPDRSRIERARIGLRLLRMLAILGDAAHRPGGRG